MASNLRRAESGNFIAVLRDGGIITLTDKRDGATISFVAEETPEIEGLLYHISILSAIRAALKEAGLSV